MPGFARLMNQTARSLGANNSNFLTPNGLPTPGHYSTARDMAYIMRAALQTPGMRGILSTPTDVIEPVSGGPQRISLRGELAVAVAHPLGRARGTAGVEHGSGIVGQWRYRVWRVVPERRATSV